MEAGQDSFEDQELEELKQLTILHRRGQISDLDFEEKTAWLLRGRSFPILTNPTANIPPQKEEEKNNTEKKKQNELVTLTSCGERSKRARQSYIRKHRESKQESLVLKTIKKETPRKAMSDSLTIEERISTSSARISAVNQSLEEMSPEENLKPVLSAFFITLFIAGSLLALYLSNGVTNEIISINQLTPLLVAHDQNPDMPMLFGPVTVSQCNILCRSKNGNNCENACRKLSFEMFPHRISLSDNSPEVLVNKLEKSCVSNFKNEKKSEINDQETPMIAFGTLENLDLNGLTKEYSNISALHEKLQKGPKDNKKTEITSLALCIRANEIISYIGAIVANSYRDHYAVAYYQLTQRALANKNASLQSKINS